MDNIRFTPFGVTVSKLSRFLAVIFTAMLLVACGGGGGGGGGGPEPTPVRGCTDSSATNYNALATEDDGSCTYPPVRGCTDSSAANYNALATEDDGSCTYPPVRGCTDSSAANYNALATEDDGSCTYPPVRGCTDSSAANYNALATEDDGSCTYPPVRGCTDSSAANYNALATEDDGSCTYPPVRGCTDSSAANYNALATEDDGSCTYPPVRGCTDSSAANYNALATEDDGSCTYPPEPVVPMPTPGEGMTMVGTPPPAPTFAYGRSVSPGLTRIPQSFVEGRSSLEWARARVAVIEVYLASESHGCKVHSVFSDSYIEDLGFECDGDTEVPFTPIHGRDSNAAMLTEIDYYKRKLGEMSNLGIVSISAPPQGIVTKLEGSLSGVIFIAAAGNGLNGEDGKESFFGTVGSYNPDHVDSNGVMGTFFDVDGKEIVGITPISRASALTLIDLAESNRILVVAGFEGGSGTYQRHPKSNGCAFLGDSCIHAPFVWPGIGSGTSFGTPHVSSSLLSVWVMFPDTVETELVKLAKACAIEESNLPGLGRVDFTCMTVSDGNSGWTLKGDGSIAGLVTVLSPQRMASMLFPGTTAVSGLFRNVDSDVDGDIELAKTVKGSFNTSSDYEAGIQGYEVTSSKGFSLLANRWGENLSFGFQYSGDNLFLISALTKRSDFFGVVEGYRNVRSFDTEFGNKNFVVRLSQQESEGKTILSATGTAVGITLQKRIAFKGVDLAFSAQGDCFLGGEAETVFGDFEMQASECNKRAETSVNVPIAEDVSFSFGSSHDLLGSEKTVTRFTSGVGVIFNEHNSFSLNGSHVSDSEGETVGALKMQWNVAW